MHLVVWYIIVHCDIVIHAMLAIVILHYFKFILTVDALQRLEELRRFAESQAYVSQMQLAAPLSSCLWILLLDADNARDTYDTYDVPAREILWNPMKASELDLVWMLWDSFSAFPALFYAPHLYPRRHACWDLRVSWLPLAALATAGCRLTETRSKDVKGLCHAVSLHILRTSSQTFAASFGFRHRPCNSLLWLAPWSQKQWHPKMSNDVKACQSAIPTESTSQGNRLADCFSLLVFANNTGAHADLECMMHQNAYIYIYTSSCKDQGEQDIEGHVLSFLSYKLVNTIQIYSTFLYSWDSVEICCFLFARRRH